MVEKNSFISNFRKWPLGFVLALTMIVAIESTVAYLDNHYILRKYGSKIKIVNSLAREDQHAFDILILGGCYLATGLDPKTITEKTGLSAFNFSVAADPSIMLPYSLLTHYIQENKKPKYIILGYVPQCLFYTKKSIEKLFLPYFYYYRKGNLGLLIQEFGLAKGFKFLIPTLGFQDMLQNGKFFSNLSNLKKKKLKHRQEEMVEKAGYMEHRIDAIYEDQYQGNLNIQNVTLQPSAYFNKYFKCSLTYIKSKIINNI